MWGQRGDSGWSLGPTLPAISFIRFGPEIHLNGTRNLQCLLVTQEPAQNGSILLDEVLSCFRDNRPKPHTIQKKCVQRREL